MKHLPAIFLLHKYMIDNKWPSNEKLYHGIWADVIKCHTSRVSVLSTESLSTILMGTSEANFWYTWMRSYTPRFHHWTRQNKQRHQYLNVLKQEQRVCPLQFSNNKNIRSTTSNLHVKYTTGEITFWDTPRSRRVSSGIVHWLWQNDLVSPKLPP